METRVHFDRVGIAEVLKRHRLRMPAHQRKYAWETRHVRELVSDIAGAMQKGRPHYFLGTLVFTSQPHGALEVADGQQRLTTTTILLAAFRDFFLELDDGIRAESIESDYLFTIDLARRERIPRLLLNADDHDFFAARVLTRPAEQGRSVQPLRESQRLLLGARESIMEYFREMREKLDDASFVDALLQWIHYLTDGAMVVTMVVPDDNDAYLMFESLIDRGLRTSQADLVKSHLFKEAGDRLPAAREGWSAMRRTIESIGGDDLQIDFLRQACNLLYGPTRERDILERIRSANKGAQDCLCLLNVLGELARDYAAIHSADHAKWNAYPDDIRSSIRTLNLLAPGQIRPLLLAAARHFSELDTACTFKRLVAWCVRFIVCGGTQNGNLDRWYCDMAHAIHRGRIHGLGELDLAARAVVPTDERFQASFETARVDAAHMARYKLRSLERQASRVPNPEWVVEEPAAINLEHVMPQDGSPDWSHVATEHVASHASRLGNLVLMHANMASKVGSQDFLTKRKAYAQSTFSLTLQVADVPSWGVKEIEQRQKVLAALAVKTWRIA